jgi:hypothetical protein
VNGPGVFRHRAQPLARAANPSHNHRSGPPAAEDVLPLLALKLLLAPALVGAASLAGRRFGPRVAGLAAALPIVAGPALLLYALEQGRAFAAAAAVGTLVGLVPLTVFCLAHAALARAALRLPRQLAAPLALAGGWAAFLAAAALLHPLPAPAWAAPLVGAAALAAGLALVPPIPADGARAKPEQGDTQPPPRHHPAVELGLRMLAAALLVVTLTGLAARLGPTWSGLLTPFPVASSVVLVGAHLADGPHTLPETIRGFLLGLYGFVAFLSALAFGLEPLGTAAAFTLGLAASLAVAATVARRPWRRGTRERPPP